MSAHIAEKFRKKMLFYAPSPHLFTEALAQALKRQLFSFLLGGIKVLFHSEILFQV